MTPSTPTPPFSSATTVLIVGIGLLGGSLGLALRRLAHPPRVIGLARREETIRDAQARGMIDAGGTDPDEWLPQADLTVLCLPVVACREFATTHAARWRPGAVVTDVGSTKGQLATTLTTTLAPYGVHFVGSHPMAGSEKSGLEYARADLYRRATVFITPQPDSPPAAIAHVRALWETLDTQLCELAPTEHDALVARTSHLLHLAAAAAVNIVLPRAHAIEGTAGGFRDFSRIASSSPEMWAEIFQDNREELVAALDEFLAELQCERERLVTGSATEFRQHLEQTRCRRNAWLEAWQARQRPPTSTAPG